MKRVLFVDTQDSILSTMAAAWFNRHASGCGAASSCGLTPAAQLDARAVQAMREVGIEIGSRVPKRIDYQMMTHADLVVLIGIDLQVFEWVDILCWEIPEPADPSIAAVRALRDQIQQQVDALIEGIRAEHADPNLTERQWIFAIESSLSAQFTKETTAAGADADRGAMPSGIAL